MNKVWFGLGALTLTFYLMAGCSSDKSPDKEIVDTKVGGEQLDSSAYQSRVAKAEATYKEWGISSNDNTQERIKKSVIQNLKLEVYMKQKMKEYGLSISDEEKNQMIDLIKTKSKVWDAEKNKNQLETALIQNKVENYLISNISVSEEEAKKAYQENESELNSGVSYTFSQIILNDQQKANEANQKLENGEDFKSVAAQYSVEKTTGKNGGLVGTLSANSITEGLLDELNKLDAGQNSGVFEVNHTYRIVRLEEKTKSKSYEEQSPEIQEQTKELVKKQKVEATLRDFYEQFQKENK